MRKIKALQVISGNDNGGGGVHVLNLISGRVDGLESDLCLIGKGDLVQKASEKNINSINIENKTINENLIDIINNNDYDIVNFHGARAAKSYAFIKNSVKKPSVVTIHSDFNRDFMNLNGIKKCISTFIFKKSLKSFKYFIAVSENTKELLKNEGYCNNASVVYNGVDIEEINRLSNEECDVSIRKNENEFVFISCARFHPVKNHEKLILAFSEVSKKYDDVRLVLIGDGSEYEKIIGLIKELNLLEKVSLLGHIKNPYRYIEKANINILTSLDEGGVPPLSVLEGFALKKTAIISKLPFIETVINRECVFFCNQYDVKDIKDAMEKAYSSNCIKNLEDKVFNLVKNNFTISEFAKRYRDAYRDIIMEEKNEK